MHKSKLNMVNRLLEKNGRTIQIIERVKINDDDLDPDYDDVCHDIKAMSVSFKNHEIASDLYKSSDLMLLVKVKPGLTPDLKMRLIKDDRQLSIINVEEVQPGETNLYFRVHCRI